MSKIRAISCEKSHSLNRIWDLYIYWKREKKNYIMIKLFYLYTNPRLKEKEKYH